MASLNDIKNWFKTGLKPTQQQFWDTWDSFWHKDQQIPAEKIEKLSEFLDAKADKEAFDTQTLATLTALDNKVDKVPGKGLSTNDFTDEYKNILDNKQHPNILSQDINLDSLLTEGEYIFESDLKITFFDSNGDTKYFTSSVNPSILNNVIFKGSDNIKITIEKYKMSPGTDEFDVYTQTVIYGNSQENTRVFKRVFTSELLGNTDFVELTNNLSQGSLSITEVSTYAEITNGDSGLYYLTVEDNNDPANPKRIGGYTKLSGGKVKLTNPRTYTAEYTGSIRIDNTNWFTFHNENYGKNYYLINNDSSYYYSNADTSPVQNMPAFKVAPFKSKLKNFNINGRFYGNGGGSAMFKMLKGRVTNDTPYLDNLTNVETLVSGLEIQTSTHVNMVVANLDENQVLDKIIDSGDRILLIAKKTTTIDNGTTLVTIRPVTITALFQETL